LTNEEIRRALRAVGLSEGDAVLMHSDLRTLAPARVLKSMPAYGMSALIAGVLEAIGKDGTLVMPTFTWDSFHDKKTVVFDVANTPSEVGSVTEFFRKMPDVIRSHHVCHSVAATGAHALDVMGDGIHPFGEGSTFDQLYRLDGWNLFLGVSFSVCTALHSVEELMQVPYRYYRDFRGSTVVLPDGTEIPSRSVEFLRKQGCRNCFDKMEAVFAREGILRIGKVGSARLINARIRDIVDVTKALVEKDLYFLVKE